MTGGAGLAPAQDVIEDALRAAGGACIVIVEESSEAEVRFANNTSTTNGVRRDRRTTVVRFAGGDGTGPPPGWRAADGAVDVGELVAAAGRDAAGSPAAPDAAPLLDPAGAAPVAVAVRRGPGRHRPRASCPGCSAPSAGAFGRAEAAGRQLAGFAEHRLATAYLGTSTGLRLRPCPAHRGLPPGAAAATAGPTPRGSAGAPPTSPTSTSAALEDELGRRMAWGRRRLELDAGRYEVVLPPDAVADLMIGLVGSAGGQEAEDGRTVFSAPGGGTRVGESLARLPFDLRSDPDRAGPGLYAVRGRHALGRRRLGVRQRARRSGPPPGWTAAGSAASATTGPGRPAPASPPPRRSTTWSSGPPGPTGSVDDLVARTGRGLLLTCLWYIREVDAATLLLTGLTRDGVYLVEDGAVVGAVNNFRFNESPVDLLSRVTEVGATVRALGREYGEWVNRTAMPALRVPDFNMSSTSAAS